MKIALITLYNPSEEVVTNVDSVANQVDKVYLCDNSLNNNAEMFDHIKNAIYLFFNKNLALSGAFNKVLRNHMWDFKNSDYILFFDQDSFVENEHIRKLIVEYDRLTELGYQVGCIGPLYFDRNTETVRLPKIKKKIDNHTFIVDNNITSSLLCQYGQLKKIDFWNDDIFLDMADWDMCWRLMNAGMTCFRTSEVLLSHTVGNGEKKIGLMTVRNGVAVREYYQTRNFLCLINKSYTPLRFKIRFILGVTIRPIQHLAVLDNRKKRFHYIIRGYIDFFKKIHGEYKANNDLDKV